MDWGREGDLGYFAFDEQDNPAGIVQVRYKSSPTSMHRNLPELALAVLPEYRGQGVGLKLMEHILAQVEKTADGVRLGVHPKKIRQQSVFIIGLALMFMRLHKVVIRRWFEFAMLSLLSNETGREFKLRNDYGIQSN
ncbi:GNAT family N-acetyltransferase [Vibrio sinaloensis]|nr:GNAT family N-acetyltransferase [Vibrio sinaloensis]